MHKLLAHQLKRLNLAEAAPPADSSAWVEFLERVDRSYNEADQERYTIERSMDLSSRELTELNKRLTTAQSIARLGYWQVDKTNHKLLWSNELQKLMEIEPGQPLPTYEEFLQLVNEEQRDDLNKMVNEAFTKGVPYETEMHLKTLKGNDVWHYVIGNPVINPDGSVTIVNGIAHDITARKETEESIAKLNRQLIGTARRAGMADIATSMLHNVGNVLNSANVSLEIMRERMNDSSWHKLIDVAELLEDNLDNMDTFLIQDKRGRMIPNYIIALAKLLEKECSEIFQESDNLASSIQHIKDIVVTQNEMSKSSGVIVLLNVCELIDEAVKMLDLTNCAMKVGISVQCNFKGDIYQDRNKLLQILINLLQNAKESIIERNLDFKSDIKISVTNPLEGEDIKITITDQGIGVTTENLDKIFGFGFTTKKLGHGYGLHASAIAATEMGGSLAVKSDGHGAGATFTLTIRPKEMSATNKKEQRHE